MLSVFAQYYKHPLMSLHTFPALQTNGVFALIEHRLFNLALPPYYLQYLVVIIIACVGEVTTYKTRIFYFTRIGSRLVRHPFIFISFYFLNGVHGMNTLHEGGSCAT